MSRPTDLPDFGKPPLNEVMLGVQFDQPAGYQQIRAGEVWNLFSAEFPKTQELPPLPPSFETFGPQLPAAGLNAFSTGIGTMHSRYWFASESGSELIQFQHDRLLHNWRRLAGQDNVYPRYESIATKFFTELDKVGEFMASLCPQSLIIRQCEIAYVNHIKPAPGESVSSWLNFLSFAQEPDDFAMSFRRNIVSASGQPNGRLICESGTAVESNGEHFISLTLTVRGAPEQPNPQSAIEFLNRGREIICRSFVEITTEAAQRVWERKV